MSSSAQERVCATAKYDDKVSFPEIIDGKINTEQFLSAARDVIRTIGAYSSFTLTLNYPSDEDQIIAENSRVSYVKYDATHGRYRQICLPDKFGKLFAPVRYDMQGNIDKLTTRYSMDEKGNSTLQDMILYEKATEKNLIAVDALMWLRRALHMILLFFERIVEDHKAGIVTEDLVAFLRAAYKETLEPYHGWMAQQMFSLLSRMTPNRSQLLLSLADGEMGKEEITLSNMESSLVNLRKNVLALKAFYKDYDLEVDIIV